MAIPRYDELMPAVLAHLARHGVLGWRELETPLVGEFELSDAEVAKEYDSGNGTVFLDRISWALSYLTMAELVKRPKRGFYQVTEVGRKMVNKPDQIGPFVKQKVAERELQRKAAKAADQASDAASLDENQATPHEALLQAYEDIRGSLFDEILDTILRKTPTEFEKLVVKLLDQMGYGGQVKDAGQVTQASNDGGIDGIIKEDVLGLGRIHIQAKRYAKDNTVGREEVQKFVGALAVAQSNKGVFITTSRYSRGAIEYAENLNGATNVVLIDGVQLAEYIYDFGLGMQSEQVVEIKKMDIDFWDGMQDQQ